MQSFERYKSHQNLLLVISFLKAIVRERVERDVIIENTNKSSNVKYCNFLVPGVH